MNKRTAIIISALLGTANVFAAGNFQIDGAADVPVKIAFPSIGCKPFRMNEDTRKFTVTAYRNLDAQYKRYEFTIMPEKDGFLKLELKGQYSRNKGKKQPNQVWITFDDIKAVGTEIRNGSFEALRTDKQGQPIVGWVFVVTSPEYEVRLLKDDGNAFEGKNAVSVWHNAFCFQEKIPLKKGMKTTFSFAAKYADTENAEE